MRYKRPAEPNEINNIDLKLVILGFLVAFFSAGVGIGGGTLLVSSLTLLFGFNFKRAASTSLATIIPISLVGAVSHLLFSPLMPNLEYHCCFIIPCVIGSIIGGRCFKKSQGFHLKLAFAIFLLVISLRMLKLFDFPAILFGSTQNIIVNNEFIFIPLFGFFVGTLAVLLGIGCGLLIVPFFLILIGFKIHEAIQLSLTTMFFLTFSATIVNNKFNLLDKVAVNILFFPALSGAFFGALLSSYLPASVLKFIFGGFLALVAIQSIADLLTAHLGKGPIIGKYYLTKITERRSK